MELGSTDASGCDSSPCHTLFEWYDCLKRKGVSSKNAALIAGFSGLALTSASIGSLALAVFAGAKVNDALRGSCADSYFSGHNVTFVEAMKHCDKPLYAWSAVGVCLASFVGLVAIAAVTATAIESAVRRRPEQYGPI